MRKLATYTVNADQLAYRSGGAWTNGKARQGVYGGTRYEGAIRFAGLSELNFSNIAISQLELRVTFLRAGGSIKLPAIPSRGRSVARP